MIPDQFRLIATSAPLVRAAGPSAAIWIGNAISAQDWSEKACNESWWWATKVEIEERTGLSDEMQETARKRLRDLGVLEERRGVLTRGASLATIWYRLDMEKLSAIVYRESRQSNTGLPGKRMPMNPANDHTSLTSSLTSEQQQPPLSPKGDSGQVAEVIGIWNDTVKTTAAYLPVARLTPKRASAVLVRLREEGWIDDFKAATTFVCQSSFHQGGNDRNWVANIDFMLRPGKATELAEKLNVQPQGKATAPGQKVPAVARMTEKDLRWAIREDKDLLTRVEEEVKQAHYARCKHRVQSPEFAAGTVTWEAAKARAEKIRLRIRDRENQLEEGT